MKIRVIIDEQSFDVEVGDLKARPVAVMVDGEPFMVWPEEQDASAPAAVPAVRPAGSNGGTSHAAAAPASTANSAATSSATVTAPIPGVIISIAVKEGDSVSVGQDLCVLEAMKMKNNIRATRAGKIAAIRVAPGDQVKRGQVMLEFSD